MTYIISVMTYIDMWCKHMGYLHSGVEWWAVAALGPGSQGNCPGRHHMPSHGGRHPKICNINLYFSSTTNYVQIDENLTKISLCELSPLWTVWSHHQDL